MSEFEFSENKPRRGRDFLIGFGAATAYVLFALVLVSFSESFRFVLISLALLLLASVVMLMMRRPHIALGVVTAIIVAPILFVGTCLAVFGLDLT
jgi:hypothetical protein